jgi:phage gp46-like protein
VTTLAFSIVSSSSPLAPVSQSPAATSSAQLRFVIKPLAREGDLSRSADGSLLTDDGIETVVMVSLFTDARATSDDGIGANEDLGGWWFDAYSDTPGENTGSKLWTLRNSTLSDETIRKLKTYCDEALAWMVEANAATSADTVVTRIEDGASCVTTIYRPGDNTPYVLNWEAFFAVQ